MIECERLETPTELAARVGLSVRQVRNLVNNGQLEHVRIGKRSLIPEGAFGRFIEAQKVKPCQEETKAHASAGSTSGADIISPGQNAVAAASARQALRTAAKLKRSS